MPETTRYTALLPCPHCGSAALTDVQWWLDETVYVDAIECDNCYACAPVNRWNERNGKPALPVPCFVGQETA